MRGLCFVALLFAVGAGPAAACASLEGLSGGEVSPVASDGGGDGAPLDAATSRDASTDTTVSDASKSLSVGLVVSLPFDENSGVVANDLSGNGNAGTLLGGAGWAPGKHGSALSLNGVDAYVRIEPGPKLAFTDGLSVAVWLNLDAVAVDSRVVTKDFVWEAKLNGRQPQLSVGAAFAAALTMIPARQWHHVAFTFAKGDCRTYVDGKPGVFETNTLDAGVGILDQNTGMHVGSSPTPDSFSKGLLDDLRLYDRALTAEEVAELAR